MKSVGDVLLAEEERFFTGREAELALMRQMFNCTSEHWRLLHFHGPDGIGKTALLRKFTHELKHQQWIHLQPSEDFQNPEQFLSALVSKIEVENLPYAQSRQNSANLDDVIHLLNHLSQAKRPFLLILDSFDHWKPIEDWFF